jgi:AcrR family transcriptional regulator
VSPTKTTKARKRVRRSSEEIRGRLLDAARDLFLERGYEATTTREISERSGVAETQLFDNFGSKDGIFDAAFVAPFKELADRYIAAWTEAARESTVEERVSMFVTGFYDLATENRRILLAAVNRRAAGGTNGHTDILDHLARTIHEIEVIDVPDLDVPAAIVAAAAMVLGVVLLDDMLTPTGQRPLGRKRLTEQMTQMLVRGAWPTESGAQSLGPS